jgi:AhpC/TSA family protein
MPFMVPLFSLSYPVLNYLTTIKLISWRPRSRRAWVTLCRLGKILEERMAALKAGEIAPEIELPAVTGKQRHKFKLSDLRGKKSVILAFYPLDWSPT